MLLFNPGDLFSGIVSLEYERALAPFFGFAFGASNSSFRGAARKARSRSFEYGVGAAVSSNSALVFSKFNGQC